MFGVLKIIISKIDWLPCIFIHRSIQMWICQLFNSTKYRASQPLFSTVITKGLIMHDKIKPTTVDHPASAAITIQMPLNWPHAVLHLSLNKCYTTLLFASARRFKHIWNSLKQVKDNWMRIVIFVLYLFFRSCLITSVIFVNFCGKLLSKKSSLLFSSWYNLEDRNL